MCPDGQVYNLHVEGTETYVAEGRVVHNCHTAPADSFYRVIMQMKNAYYRVGLSGTPLARGDEKSLYAIAAIGKVVHRVRTQLLIERGVLAKPTVRMITVTTPSIRPTWQGVEGECIVRNTRRNLALASIAKRATKPAFLFVSQIAHGKNLAKILINAGISAEFVWGNHSVEYRKSLIRRMVQGHFEVLVCSSVFNEGIDVPELRATINGGGGKSVIATYQRLGRGMRVERKTDGTVAEGGDQFEVWDILDKGNKWTERHAQARQSAYAAEGYATFVEPEFQAPKSGRVSAQIIQSGGAGDAFPHKAKALLVSPSGVSDEGLEVLKRIHVTPKAGGAPEGRQRT